MHGQQAEVSCRKQFAKNTKIRIWRNKKMRSSSEVTEEDRVSLFIFHIIREDISYFADDNVSCRIEAVHVNYCKCRIREL